MHYRYRYPVSISLPGRRAQTTPGPRQHGARASCKLKRAHVARAQRLGHWWCAHFIWVRAILSPVAIFSFSMPAGLQSSEVDFMCVFVFALVGGLGGGRGGWNRVPGELLPVFPQLQHLSQYFHHHHSYPFLQLSLSLCPNNSGILSSARFALWNGSSHMPTPSIYPVLIEMLYISLLLCIFLSQSYPCICLSEVKILYHFRLLLP